MSDSDLLGIIARNPQARKPTLSRFRPPSPKASNVLLSRRDRLNSPSPPASPDAVFRSTFGVDDAADDPALDESASIVAERLLSPASSLLGVMQNDDPPPHVVAETPSIPFGINRFHGPVRIPRQGFDIRNYGDPVPAVFQAQEQPVMTESVPTQPLPSQPHGPLPEMLAAEQELQFEKERIIVELSLKRVKGYDIPPHLGLHSSLEELRAQIASIRRVENHKRTVSMLRYLMIIGCTGVEKATMAFLSDVYLEGWSETVAANQDDYNDVIGRIADTMDLSASIPPHVELVVMLGVSGVLFHMSKKNRAGLLAAVDPPQQPSPAPKDTKLSEEQLRIHTLITGKTNADNPVWATDYDTQSLAASEKSFTNKNGRAKKARLTVDSDEIVRLF